MSYLTNFQPNIITDFNNIKLFKIKKKHKIICRNFFLFILLLKYFKKNNFFNVHLFVKPFKKKLFTILRAPYRHKLTRHQLTLNRFKIIASIQIKNNKIIFLNEEQLFNLLMVFNKFYIWFESNIVFQHRVKVSFDFYFKNNFTFIYFNK